MSICAIDFITDLISNVFFLFLIVFVFVFLFCFCLFVFLFCFVLFCFFVCVYLKLDYFYISAFDLEVKATELLK